MNQCTYRIDEHRGGQYWRALATLAQMSGRTLADSESSSASEYTPEYGAASSSSSSHELSAMPPATAAVEATDVNHSRSTVIEVADAPSSQLASNRDHVCLRCSKRFKRASHLTVHVKHVHDDARSHICHFCSDRFKLSHHLKRHLTNVHQYPKPARRHKCPNCLRVFTTRSNLSRHVRADNSRGGRITATSRCAGAQLTAAAMTILASGSAATTAATAAATEEDDASGSSIGAPLSLRSAPPQAHSTRISSAPIAAADAGDPFEVARMLQQQRRNYRHLPRSADEQ